MSQLSTLAAATRYELAMQARRKALWVGFALAGILLVVGFNSAVRLVGPHTYAGNRLVFAHRDALFFWTQTTAFLLMIAGGILLADRTPRDRRTHAAELLDTSPAPLWARFAGKYLGSAAATLLPVAVLFAVGIALMVLRWGDVSILPLAAAAFAALIIPPLLFVGAYSLACTTLMWQPLYMFLFVGYCLWNALNPSGPIPTLSGTYLSPNETYVYPGFFGFTGWNDGFLHPSVVLQGVANIAVLLAAAAVTLVAGWAVLRWQAIHH
jgi:ABC-2 type transport system permease protein